MVATTSTTMSANKVGESVISEGYSTHCEGQGDGQGDSEVVPERRLTAYERLSHDLSNDQRCLKEITLGKRIGFYRLRGELGSGNFSQVKMGIHSLTKGQCFEQCVRVPYV